LYILLVKQYQINANIADLTGKHPQGSDRVYKFDFKHFENASSIPICGQEKLHTTVTINGLTHKKYIILVTVPNFGVIYKVLMSWIWFDRILVENWKKSLSRWRDRK